MCATAVVAASVVVLVGWAIDNLLLKRAFLGSVMVRPNAAVALGFAGLSVLLIRHRFGRLLGIVPLVIGALTTAEYLYRFDFGIDDLLFHGDPGVPMRMSVRAAIASACAGVAIVARHRAISQFFSGIVGFIGTLSTVAYLYGAEFLPHASVTPIAFATAILILLWSIAFIAATSGHGPVTETFLREDQWGRTTRQLSLVALIVPALFGALCLFETKEELFDLPFAVALITTATSFTLIGTIVRYTADLRVEDERRTAAEEASRAADALYRTIVETSQEGICVVDASRHFTFVNQHLAAMLGYSPAEMIGMHSDEIVHPDDRVGVAERAAARRPAGRTRTELRLLRRDGSIVHAISAATLVPATANTPEFVLATLSDITDRVAAEAALRASEARFRSLYEANLVGVAFVNIDRTEAATVSVTDANDAFRQMFEIEANELPGFAWSARNTTDGAATDQGAMWHLRETGRCAPFEKDFLRRDGSRFAAIVAMATIDEETTVAFVIDVSEKVEARRTLERAHEILSTRLAALEGGDGSLDVRELDALAARLAEANEELETFSYSVSHDLRAPLRAIDGFSRELQTGHADALDAQGQKYLARIRAATQRMSQLIDDLLSLSRLSRKPMNRIPVDVTAMAGEVANEVRERSGSNVTFSIEPGLTTSADPHLLRVVFENLIGNAVKFSSKRDDARVEIFSVDGDGTFGVRDNGAGFDSRYAVKIFAPFQRLHTTEYEGTGIGLALVQRIVRRHGGMIRAESQPGDGATFFFTLSPTAEVTP